MHKELLNKKYHSFYVLLILTILFSILNFFGKSDSNNKQGKTGITRTPTTLLSVTQNPLQITTQVPTLASKPTISLSPTLTQMLIPVASPGTTSSQEIHTVTKIIDGDTIELDNGRRVRYIGIDTPEVGKCYAQEAKQFNSDLVLNKKVIMVKDVSETDRYKRLLRYVYVDEKFINEELVRKGYAFAVTYPPDVAYQSLFKEAEQEARNQSLGLWGQGCPVPTRRND